MGVLINNHIKHQSRILHDKHEITSFESIELVITLGSVTVLTILLQERTVILYQIAPSRISSLITGYFMLLYNVYQSDFKQTSLDL